MSFERIHRATHRLILSVFFVCLFGYGLAPALRADDPASLPSSAELEKSGAVVGQVVIRVKNIFDLDDPEEDRSLYRLADHLHLMTRERVIAEQLLFKTGDRFSQHALDESARLLRTNRYLYDATIRPVRYVRDNAGGKVDVEVVTHDVWTLNAGIGLGRSGGSNTTRFLLQDTNFLGTGRAVTFQRETSVDRTTSFVRYDDKELFGTHGLLSATYADNSDGKERSFDLEEPFYALDTRWAAGVSATQDGRVDSLYALGHAIDYFHRQSDSFELHGGLSNGLVDGWVRRWTAGFAYDRERFSIAGGGRVTTLVPADRTLSYPWVSFDLVQDRYSEARNLDQIQRTEDLQLGSQAHFALGFSSTVLGGNRDVAVFDAALSSGFKPAAGQTLLFGSDLSGRWGSGGGENVVLLTSARYYWRDFGEHLFFVTVEADAAHRLDVGNQLLLGGDTGLRGYPLRYQDGDRRALITLEQRFFTNYYPFRLVRIGAAVFFDAGRTWSGDSARAPNLGLLKDAGIGLRLSPSRSGLGNVVHLDLAFPLDGDPSIKRVQWLVRTKASF